MKRCHAILAVDVILLLVIVTLTSCSMKQWYPTMGAVVGGGAGSPPREQRGRRGERNNRRFNEWGCFSLGGKGHGSTRERIRGIYLIYKTNTHNRGLYPGGIPFNTNFRSPKNRRDLFKNRSGKTFNSSTLSNK